MTFTYVLMNKYGVLEKGDCGCLSTPLELEFLNGNPNAKIFVCNGTHAVKDNLRYHKFKVPEILTRESGHLEIRVEDIPCGGVTIVKGNEDTFVTYDTALVDRRIAELCKGYLFQENEISALKEELKRIEKLEADNATLKKAVLELANAKKKG